MMLPDRISHTPLKTLNKLKVYLPQVHFLWENLYLFAGTQSTLWPHNQPAVTQSGETAQEIDPRNELIALLSDIWVN